MGAIAELVHGRLRFFLPLVPNITNDLPQYVFYGYEALEGAPLVDDHDLNSRKSSMPCLADA